MLAVDTTKNPWVDMDSLQNPTSNSFRHGQYHDLKNIYVYKYVIQSYIT